MPKEVRLSDIAERIGVSTVTVSKALADKQGMGEDLRAKIKETASAMGYTPSKKKNLQKPSTGNIGILVPQRFLYGANSFYWDMYQRLLHCLLEKTYFGLLEILSIEDEDNLVVPRMLQDKKIDGIIILGQLDRPYREFISSVSGEILVYLDSDEVSQGDTCIISDGYYGMYTMTKYLISMGHRDIYFVGSIDATSSILDRYYGYCRAMHERKFPVTPDMIIPDRDEKGRMGFTLPDRLPSAFACNSDATAGYLITLLKEHNLEIPNDISVVGFDDYMLPGLSHPSITTYAVDIDKMVSTCANIIIQKILNNNYLQNTTIINGHIVIRDSVKKIE
ncbi:LacI family DNA-binding transcriptional regulator [Treponema primitia]|uniref:LacI family DNA-binding transcriptional regulator n=1 Tax=Treponema primitia TaxID=88058 RepID=UPI000255503D|nr:LacI family DNA-binding transcriptional regulator [Treponema primitia]